MIPGLENAEFLRLGSIHRNTYVNSPRVLTPHLEVRSLKNVYLAGQITGVEGYVESAACGLMLGIILWKKNCQARMSNFPLSSVQLAV